MAGSHSIASRPSCSAARWSGSAGNSCDIALLIDEHSASDLRFPMWIYYAALPVGGFLMLIRYVIRLAGLVAMPGGADDHAPSGQP